MDWKQELRELWHRATWTGTATFTLPPVLFEIQPDFLVGARLTGRAEAGAQLRFARVAVQPIEPGMLSASPAGPVVADATGLAAALEQTASAIGNGQARVGLLVPDLIVRVGVFPFDALPSNRREAATLMGWRMRENLPFPPEEARIAHQSTWPPSTAAEPQQEVTMVAVRSSVAAEFEGLVEAVNRSSDLMVPATMALLPLLSAEREGGQLLVHVYSSSATYAVVEGQRLRFWRSRDFGGLDLEEMFTQVAAEAARVVASTEDRLRLPLACLWFCARPPATPQWADQLSQALGREIQQLEPRSDLGEALAGEDRSVFMRYGATLAGLVVNH